jgi:hypothetical protein
MVLPTVGNHRLPYWLAIALPADRSTRNSWYDIETEVRGRQPKERMVARQDPCCPPKGPDIRTTGGNGADGPAGIPGGNVEIARGGRRAK